MKKVVLFGFHKGQKGSKAVEALRYFKGNDCIVTLEEKDGSYIYKELLTNKEEVKGITETIEAGYLVKHEIDSTAELIIEQTGDKFTLDWITKGI